MTADLLKERDHLNGAVSSSPPTHHAAPPYSPLGGGGGGGGAEAGDGAGGGAGAPPPPPPRPERPASLTAGGVGKSGGRHPRWLLCYQSSSAPCPGSGGPHSPSPPMAPSQRRPPPPYPATPPAGRPASLPAPLHRPSAHGEFVVSSDTSTRCILRLAVRALPDGHRCRHCMEMKWSWHDSRPARRGALACFLMDVGLEAYSCLSFVCRSFPVSFSWLFAVRFPWLAFIVLFFESLLMSVWLECSGLSF